MYNEGISKMGDLLDLATELEIIAKRGSFFSYGDMRLGALIEQDGNPLDFIRVKARAKKSAKPAAA